MGVIINNVKTGKRYCGTYMIPKPVLTVNDTEK